MKLSRIKDLDLRPIKVVEEFNWNWPKPPEVSNAN